MSHWSGLNGQVRRLGAIGLVVALLPLALVQGGTAHAAPRDPVLISVSSSGVPGNDRTLVGYLSADGRFSAFTSGATDLVPGDTNEEVDVFVRDTVLNQTTRISVSPEGDEGSSDSVTPGITPDGRYVLIVSTANNLVAGDTNGASDLFVHDRVSGTTTRVSTGDDGGQSDDDTIDGSISADGRYVAFASESSNLTPGDNANSRDIFVKDLQTGQLQRLTDKATGHFTLAPRITPDGRYVSYMSDDPSAPPEDPAGIADAFVWDRTTGSTWHLTGLDGAPLNASATIDAMSADGQQLVVSTAATNLVAGDTNPAALPNVFLVDRQTGQTQKLSTGIAGAPPNGWSSGADTSDDGSIVTFTSVASNLVAEDTDTGYDAYVYHRDSGLLEVVTAAPMEHRFDAIARDVSPDGRFMMLSTYLPLVPGDSNGRDDIYRLDITEVDEVAPVVTLDSVPPATSGDDTPTFEFSSEPDATFECSLSTGADSFADCESPFTASAQPDGDYVFKVRATDLAGNTGTPATHAFEIDTRGPVATIESGPPPLSSNDSPTFVFSGPPGATYDCSLHLVGLPDFWGSECVSPSYWPGLADGTYVFKVRAVDAGTTGEPDTITFTIDSTGPPSTIQSGPPSPTADNTPTFTFSSEPGAPLECSLTTEVNDVWQPCTSPLTYPAQVDGTYTFKVRAFDDMGNPGVPAEHWFSLETAQITACTTATNVINGTAANNNLRGGALPDRISGLGGNDTIQGFAAGDCLLGGTGTDNLKGGNGADELVGGDGNDTLAGGAGSDVLTGSLNVDRMYAVDGAVDTVDCGPGANELATVDAVDSVIGCERVRFG